MVEPRPTAPSPDEVIGSGSQVSTCLFLIPLDVAERRFTLETDAEEIGTLAGSRSCRCLFWYLPRFSHRASESTICSLTDKPTM